MEPISVDLAKIELLADLVKIGIPALVGLIAGLIPFFLEKTKMKAQDAQEEKKYYQSQVSDLIDNFTEYAGNYFRYLGFIISDGMRSEEMKEMTLRAGDDALKNEVKLKKARALAGLLGQKKLMDHIDQFDNLARENLNDLVRNPKRNDTTKTDNVRAMEREVFILLGQILDKGSK